MGECNEESAYEHNMRYTHAIGQHVLEVDKAVNLLKKCDYHVLTKKEYDQRDRVTTTIVIMISLTSFVLGFAICMITLL